MEEERISEKFAQEEAEVPGISWLTMCNTMNMKLLGPARDQQHEISWPWIYIMTSYIKWLCSHQEWGLANNINSVCHNRHQEDQAPSMIRFCIIRHGLSLEWGVPIM